MTKNINSSKSFEWQVAKIAFVTAVIPVTVCLLLLLQADISNYVKVMVLLVVITSLSFGCFMVYQRVNNQIRTTTNIVEAIIAGDSTIKPNSLVVSGGLAELNQVISSASQRLAEQRLLSKEHHMAMAKVLEHISVAVITLDEMGFVNLINPKAKQLFSLEDDMLGLSAASLGLDLTALSKQSPKVVTLTINNTSKKVYMQLDSYQLNGQTYTLVFLNDVQKLLQQQERAAWQRLLRVLSHEINNSLAPIASIGESLADMVDEQLEEHSIKGDLTQGLTIISQRALTLDKFIKQYQQLSKLPVPSKALFSLTDFVTQQLALFPSLDYQLTSATDVQVYADQEQLAQVIVNLVKNAQQATDSEQCQLTISWQVNSGLLKLCFSDNGTGISNPDNLFVPFYTTKKSGSGIGLVFSRQIMFNHGGDLTLSNNELGCGATACLFLPVHDSLS